MIAKKRNKKHAEEKSLGQVVADKRINICVQLTSLLTLMFLHRQLEKE